MPTQTLKTPETRDVGAKSYATRLGETIITMLRIVNTIIMSSGALLAVVVVVCFLRAGPSRSGLLY